MGDGKPYEKDARTLGPEEVVETFKAKERPSGLAPRSSRDAAPGPDTRARLGNAETLPPPRGEPSGPRYVLVKELGRGGMGRVDEVFDAALGRPVAQKTVLASSHATLLVAEAQTCAQLEHPSIVPVYDLGAGPEGQPYYTMRQIRGRTLREVLRDNADPAKQRRTLVQMLNVLRQVCLAVDYAHSRGVVHRDLKPENVIVGEFGEVYVLDWGIAHLMEGSDVKRPELAEYVAGSPGYMAPEQEAGGPIDSRTDVYALGAILYEMLTGRVPFEDPGFKVPQHPGLDAPPSARNPNVSSSFDSLVASCLQPDPDDRLPTARFVADAIDVYLDGERERTQRETEAERYASEGEASRDAFVALQDESKRLAREADAALAEVPRWESAGVKTPAWEKQARARELAGEAARALARAETAFMRALGRVENHRRARRGLAGVSFRQFEDAETAGEAERMAHYLDVARAYDDGDLALELADEGEVTVVCEEETARVVLARYEPRGPLLELGREKELGWTPTLRLRLPSGSYLIVASAPGGRQVRYPLLLRRARRHTVRLRMPRPDELPEGMVLIPGGPTAGALQDERLRDFAIGRFPVTFAQYAAFLDTLPDAARAARMPPVESASILRGPDGAWHVTEYCVEGEGRKRIAGRELDVPADTVSWYDAQAYVQWLAAKTGLPYRLPTDAEWEKAMRGADARPFPMGTRMDPSFAKLRESRPEASQPEPVGAFPLDESPYGVRDMAGGVGDWTSTMTDGARPPRREEEGTAADNREAVWRGGSWSSTRPGTEMRYTQMLHHRVGWVGFRLALSLRQHGSSDLVVEPMKRG